MANLPMKSTQKTILFWMFLFVGVLILFQTSTPRRKENFPVGRLENALFEENFRCSGPRES